MEPILLPPLVLELARACRDRGGRALLVGGGVRDHLLELPVKDWDIEVYGLEEERLAALLRRLGTVNAVGRAFGVFKLTRDHLELDVSLPRRDSKTGPGHKGIAVSGDPHLSFAEATRRRDLTVNAILFDPLEHQIIDPHGGRADLARRLLRAVDPHTFLEDPLRALRAVQFAARLRFDVDPSLVELCRAAALDELPPERIQEEWRKLLLHGRQPSLGLALARQAQILERVFPEAARCDDPSVDAALDRLAAAEPLQPEGRQYSLMLSAWLHRCEPDAVTQTLDRLWLHKWLRYPLRDRVGAAVAHWPVDAPDDSTLRHLSTATELELTLTLRWGLSGDDAPLEQLSRARLLGIAHEPPRRLLLGRHLGALGIAPGKAMGQVLDYVYALQLDGTITTNEEALAEARAWWEARG